MPVSSRGYFAMAKETTAGTPRTRQATVSHNSLTLPAYWAYPAEEIEFMAGKEFIDFREIRGSRQAYTTLDGAFRPTANLKGAVYPGAAFGQLVYGILGDVRVYGVDGADSGSEPDEPGEEITYQAWTGATTTQKAYEMIFSDGAALPNFTLERSDGRDGSATIVEQMSGCKLESLQFTANFGEKVNMTAQFQGAKKPVSLATSSALAASDIVFPGKESGSPVSDPTPLYFNRAAIKIAGSQQTAGYMKSLNFDMKNTITRQEVLNAQISNTYPFQITETVDSYKLFEGGMECTLSGNAVFENTDFYDRVLNGETISLELFLASNSLADANAAGGTDDVPYLVYFYWPKVKVSKASLPFKAGEVIESAVEFKVIYDPNAVIKPFTSNTAISGIEGGSVFVKMISHCNGKLSNGILRPSFYF